MKKKKDHGHGEQYKNGVEQKKKKKKKIEKNATRDFSAFPYVFL